MKYECDNRGYGEDVLNRIIITGATGFIGVFLIKEWLKQTCEIYAVIRPGSEKKKRIPQSERVHIVELSIDEYDKIPEVITKGDLFYHLAWEGTRAPLRDDYEIQIRNYNATVAAFQAARDVGCKLFVGSGSQAEYGKMSGVVDENSPCFPDTAYGKEKLHAFNSLADMAERMGIRLVWPRLFSVYGPYDYPGTLIMTCIYKMMRNEEVDISKGDQLWDYLYVEDAAQALVMMANCNSTSGVYIVASGYQRPLREYVLAIRNITGSNSCLRFGNSIDYEKEKINLMPDPSKLKKLGWKPNTTFQDGIRYMVAMEE